MAAIPCFLFRLISFFSCEQVQTGQWQRIKSSNLVDLKNELKKQIFVVDEKGVCLELKPLWEMNFSQIPPLLFLCPKKYGVFYLSLQKGTQDYHTSQEETRPIHSKTRPQQSRPADARWPLVYDFTTVNFHADEICVFVCLTETEKEKARETETLQWFMTSCLCVCLFLSVCVSKWEGPPVVYLRHSVHQRRSVLFVLLHSSVSDGSLMMMAGWALAARTDATLGGGRPPSSSPPWWVLHTSLIVTVHTDLWEKRKQVQSGPTVHRFK